ncbi:hypothetical protein [Natrinema salinisoli]|uniref:hypothetical protein n=1 Tax=Natrinema salinisoli TaxID=2878535 RepID=UPI001CEFB79C|nr:hypothetical protein [Natrinema salinisoli]
MTHSVVHLLGILFAITAGTGAGVFALLSWGIFQDSPFGTAIALLSLGMLAVTIYHIMLLVEGPDSILHFVRSAANTIVAVVLGMLILRNHQPAGERS